MRRELRWVLLPAAALAAQFVVARPPAPTAAPSEDAKSVTCSFSNPAFSGYCRETRRTSRDDSGARVCAGILACLNDARCSRTYCSATQIRGGWKLEKIEGRTSPSKPPAPSRP